VHSQLVHHEGTKNTTFFVLSLVFFVPVVAASSIPQEILAGESDLLTLRQRMTARRLNVAEEPLQTESA
jgi:hypothetical protein